MLNIISRIALALTFVLIPAFGGAGEPPDLILVNGKVVTVDARFTIAQAIAIKGERVLAVGRNAMSRSSRVRQQSA